MCNFSPGRLILGNNINDDAAHSLINIIREGGVAGVNYGQSIRERLTNLEIDVPHNFSMDIHLLRTRDGEEIFEISELHTIYADILSKQGSTVDVGQRVIISPDNDIYPDSLSVNLTTAHDTYKNLLQIPALHSASKGAGVKVAIIDSGLSTTSGISPSVAVNFTNDSRPRDVEDVLGHGTAVTKILTDVAPDCELAVLKVGDFGRVSEWNAIAALISAGTSDVVNMSLGFSLADRDCRICGRRQSHSARSAVYERVIDELLSAEPGIVLVAAAGNRGRDKLDFPSRFASCVAVGAIDQLGNRPAYSNFGAMDHRGAKHHNLYFAPGGANYEPIATVSGKSRAQHLEGTSFSAPYVSGLIAIYVSQTAPPRDRKATLDYLRKCADSSPIQNFDPDEFGNGIPRL